MSWPVSSSRAARCPAADSSKRVEGGQVREVARHRRVGRGECVGVAGDRPVDDLQPALGRHVQPVARGVRRIPREQPAAQPVRGTHSAQDHRGIVADHVSRMVVRERERAARRLERDVRAARRPARAVVLVPRAVQRDLVLERPGRHHEAAAEQTGRARDRLQPRLRALRLPVARAAQLGLQRAHQRDRGRGRRVVRLRRTRQERQDDHRREDRRPHRARDPTPARRSRRAGR